jgi:hypothetical protein
MRERAEELGGRCVVESLPAGGTRVRATLPLAGGTTSHGGMSAHEAPSGTTSAGVPDSPVVAGV